MQVLQKPKVSKLTNVQYLMFLLFSWNANKVSISRLVREVVDACSASVPTYPTNNRELTLAIYSYKSQLYMPLQLYQHQKRFVTVKSILGSLLFTLLRATTRATILTFKSIVSEKTKTTHPLGRTKFIFTRTSNIYSGLSRFFFLYPFHTYVDTYVHLKTTLFFSRGEVFFFSFVLYTWREPMGKAGII